MKPPFICSKVHQHWDLYDLDRCEEEGWENEGGTVKEARGVPDEPSPTPELPGTQLLRDAIHNTNGPRNAQYGHAFYSMLNTTDLVMGLVRPWLRENVLRDFPPTAQPSLLNWVDGLSMPLEYMGLILTAQKLAREANTILKGIGYDEGEEFYTDTLSDIGGYASVTHSSRVLKKRWVKRGWRVR